MSSSLSAPLSPRAGNASPTKTKAASERGDAVDAGEQKENVSGNAVESMVGWFVPGGGFGKVADDESGNAKKTYVSPSDNIMSPTTAKLRGLKGKKFAGSHAKPTSLFARASENAARAASRSPEPEGAGTNIASLGRFLGPAIDVGSTSTSCGETTTSPADGVGVEVEVEAEAESREEEKEVSKGDGTA